jgi:predicted enzyme related to lactoylglutathione lyase
VVVEKFSIACLGYAAYFTDPGGLIVGIHEYDENAK